MTDSRDDKYDDDHYSAENAENGVHACSDGACMTAGLTMAELTHLGFALSVLEPVLADTPVATSLFRDDTGLHVLLTVRYGDNRAIIGAVYTPHLFDDLRRIGAVYTPHLFDDLRRIGYTMTHAEAQSGVN